MLLDVEPCFLKMSSGGLCKYDIPAPYDKVIKADTERNIEMFKTSYCGQLPVFTSHFKLFLFIFSTTCDNWGKNVNQY